MSKNNNLLPIQLSTDDGKRNLEIIDKVFNKGVTIMYESPHYPKTRLPIGKELWDQLVKEIKERG